MKVRELIEAPGCAECGTKAEVPRTPTARPSPSATPVLDWLKDAFVQERGPDGSRGVAVPCPRCVVQWSQTPGAPDVHMLISLEKHDCDVCGRHRLVSPEAAKAFRESEAP